MKAAQRESTSRQPAVIRAGLGPHTVWMDEGEVKLEGMRLGGRRLAEWAYIIHSRHSLGSESAGPASSKLTKLP